MTEMLENYFFQAGVKKAFIAVVVALVLAILDFETVSFFAFVFALFTLYVYAKPKRFAASLDGKGVVSPVDAKVLRIDEEHDGYKLVLESSPFMSGVVYAPVDGKISSIVFQKGTRLPKHSMLFEKLNERVAIEWESENGTIGMTQITKRTPYDMQWLVRNGQNLFCAQPLGFAHNCVTEITLPKSFRLNVKSGEKLVGSQTIVGYFSA